MEYRSLKQPKENKENVGSPSRNQSGRDAHHPWLYDDHSSRVKDTESSQINERRMDDKFKERALSYFEEAELHSYREGCHKPLHERSVKEAIAVAMFEKIYNCQKEDWECHWIEEFVCSLRENDRYKQAYSREESSSQQQEVPNFEEDREKLPKQKQTSESWSHAGEKRQSNQAWEDASPSKRQRIDVDQEGYKNALESFVKDLKVHRKRFSGKKIRNMLEKENINIKEERGLKLLQNCAKELYDGARDKSMSSTYNAIYKWIDEQLSKLRVEKWI